MKYITILMVDWSKKFAPGRCKHWEKLKEVENNIIINMVAMIKNKNILLHVCVQFSLCNLDFAPSSFGFASIEFRFV
jgi:hypothetical protein